MELVPVPLFWGVRGFLVLELMALARLIDVFGCTAISAYPRFGVGCEVLLRASSHAVLVSGMSNMLLGV